MPRRHALVALLAALSASIVLACGGQARSAATVAEPPIAVTTTEVPELVVHSLVPIRDGSGLMVLGQLRVAEDDFRAWVGRFDRSGALVWSDRIGMGFRLANTMLVDAGGGAHVLSHDARGNEQLVSYGPQGRRRSLLDLDGERVGFQLRGEFVDLFHAYDRGALEWTRLDWAHPGLPTERRLLELDSIRYSRGLEPRALDDVTVLLGPTPARRGGAQRLAPVVVGEDCKRVPDNLWAGQWLELWDLRRALELASPTVDASAEELGRTPRVLTLAGGSQLLVAQLGGRSGQAPRLLVEGLEPGREASRVTEIEALTAAPLDRPDWGPSQWPSLAWLWLWPMRSASEHTQDPRYLGWLHSDRCSSGSSRLRPEHPFVPSDPCWKQLQLERALPVLDAERFTASLDDWMELLALSYERSVGATLESEAELRAAIIAAAVHAGHRARLLDTLALVLDDERAFAVALELLESAPADAVRVELPALLEQLRPLPGRCDSVQRLAELLGRRGGALPQWQAERDQECDILYVLCTGLLSEAERSVLAPGLVTFTVDCVDGDTLAPDCESDAATTLERPITAQMVDSCIEYETDNEDSDGYYQAYEYDYAFDFRSDGAGLYLEAVHEDLEPYDEYADEDW